MHQNPRMRLLDSALSRLGRNTQRDNAAEWEWAHLVLSGLRNTVNCPSTQATQAMLRPAGACAAHEPAVSAFHSTSHTMLANAALHVALLHHDTVHLVNGAQHIACRPVVGGFLPTCHVNGGGNLLYSRIALEERGQSCGEGMKCSPYRPAACVMTSDGAVSMSTTLGARSLEPDDCPPHSSVPNPRLIIGSAWMQFPTGHRRQRGAQRGAALSISRHSHFGHPHGFMNRWQTQQRLAPSCPPPANMTQLP